MAAPRSPGTKDYWPKAPSGLSPDRYLEDLLRKP
jgi:hypothetical protein